MKTKGKALLLVLCAMLLVVASVLGTLAYLTYTTQTVENTFVVGKVSIALDEAEVDEYGKNANGRTTTGNEYTLLPGHTYIKDPTVTVNAESELAYVRVLVTVDNMNSLTAAFPQTSYPEFYGADGTFLLQMLCCDETGACTWDPDTWAYAGYENGVYEFRYVGSKSDNGVVDAGAGDVVLEPLFTDITVPGFVSNQKADGEAKSAIELLSEVDINIVAHAIQADTFDDAADAWTHWE